MESWQPSTAAWIAASCTRTGYRVIIEKKRVRNIAQYLNGLPPNGEVRPIVEIDDDLATKLPSLGFEEPITTGSTVLPKAVGAIRRFNAEGRWEVHRDQPKESRYIRTVSWRWKTWDGAEHEELRDICRMCWPRTRIPAPGIEITVLGHDGKIFLAAPAYSNTSDQHDALRHAVNLLLEIAGRCELRAADLDVLTMPPVKRMTWAMLPSGKHPFARIDAHLDAVLKRSGKNARRVIEDRQRTILTYKPTEMHVGLGGFEEYIAYVFADRGLVVLECIRRGNAIYAFGRDWKSLAQLTKAEIIDGDLHVARIVHSEGWKFRLSRLLNQKKSA